MGEQQIKCCFPFFIGDIQGPSPPVCVINTTHIVNYLIIVYLPSVKQAAWQLRFQHDARPIYSDTKTGRSLRSGSIYCHFYGSTITRCNTVAVAGTRRKQWFLDYLPHFRHVWQGWGAHFFND